MRRATDFVPPVADGWWGLQLSCGPIIATVADKASHHALDSDTSETKLHCSRGSGRETSMRRTIQGISLLLMHCCTLYCHVSC